LELIEHVRVIETDPEHALEGLIDQILVRGLGVPIQSKDNRVIKTGASDSAWLRSVLETAELESTNIAVVSKTSAFRRFLVKLLTRRSSTAAYRKPVVIS
jgi:hypothetical protein